MREILFRGKTPITGTWVYGTGLLYDGINTWVANNEPPNPLAFGEIHNRVIPETIGQYTGLTDKNGKKIFEGDIFAHPNKKKYKYVVDWIDDIASFSWFNGDGVGFDNKEIEIIGNIHDNPELLGGDTDV